MHVISHRDIRKSHSVRSLVWFPLATLLLFFFSTFISVGSPCYSGLAKSIETLTTKHRVINMMDCHVW